jgi:hypothetical protein
LQRVGILLCVQFCDILYKTFWGILYTPARRRRGLGRLKRVESGVSPGLFSHASDIVSRISTISRHRYAWQE